VTVGIIGLGLMGGSLAKAVKKYNIANKVYGYVRNDEQKKEVLDLSLVDEVVDIDTLKKECDLIVLAVAVDTIIDLMPQLLDIKETTTIIDLGSTKEIIINNIPSNIRKNFVALHPMVGTEKNGPKAAIDNFYEGHIVVLCNIEDNDEFHSNRILNLFQDIGMKIVKMNAKEHDIHSCYMSHLPHVISYSLANTVMGHEDPKSIIALAAGGFRDMSRVAKSSPRMWTDIFKQNRENLLESIDLFEAHMKSVRDMVENENYDELEKWMVKANTLHEIL